jgi:phage pi2 protein 07
MTMFKLEATGVSKDIIKLLGEQGLNIRQVLDLDMPEFPEDITLVDDQELMVMASKYMENYNMMRTQTACAQVAELEAENDYDRAEAYALMETSTGKATEKAGLLKAAVLLRPEIQDKLQVKSYVYAYRKLMETTQDNMERYYNLVSRELTRRTSSDRDRMRNNRFTA